MLTDRAIRVINILAASREGLKRVDLATEADISAPTLQRALVELRRAGWIGHDFTGGPLRGRMTGALRLTRKAGLLVGVDAGRRHIRSVLADVHGNPLGESVEAEGPINVEESGPELLRTIAETVIAALACGRGGESPYRLSEVRGIGVGVPSPVDSRGMVVGMFLPQWSGLPLPRILARHLAREAEKTGDSLHPDLQITVAKDADLGALIMWQEHTEQRLTTPERGRKRRRGAVRLSAAIEPDPDVVVGDDADEIRQDSLVFVKASTGIDAGLICEGQRVTGARGLAGQLGHMLVPHSGDELLANVSPQILEDLPIERCQRCTRRRCLENLSSGGAIMRQLRRLEGIENAPKSFEELMMWVRSHQMTSLHLETVVVAGTRLGLVLAEVARLADPTTVVIGGLMAMAGDTFMTPLRVAFADATISGLEPELICLDAGRVRRIELEGAIVLARKHLRF